MRRTAIKICGITNETDALDAIDAGANLLGLIFVPASPRHILPGTAKKVAKAVRAKNPAIKLVGVFQDHSAAEIHDIHTQVGLDLAQLHGGETLSFCQSLPIPAIKTVILDPDFNEADLLGQLEQYAPSGNANIESLLLDLPKHAKGMSFASFSLPPAVCETLRSTHHFVAGGLNPANVGDVILTRRPDGVDVASGVERSPGRKDPLKMRLFCQNIRAAEEAMELLGDSSTCNR